MKRDRIDAWLDEQPEFNSNYGTYRDHVNEPASPFYDEAQLMVTRRLRHGQYQRRLRRLSRRKAHSGR